MKKKLSYILLTTVLTLCYSMYVNADVDKVIVDYNNEINKNINGGNNTYLPNTASSDKEDTHYKLTTDNKIAYCSEGKKTNPKGESTWNNCQVLKGLNSISLSYIYENGYKEHKDEYSSNNYLIGNNKYQDYFITQIAVWEYTDRASWQKNFDYTDGTYNGETNTTTTKISNLVNDAKKAQSGASIDITVSDTSMSLTSDGKYYISNEIKISGKYLNNKITTSIEGPKEVFTTSNKDGNESETSFENNSTIYIKVPVESFNKDAKITLTIKSTTAIGEGRIKECVYTGTSSDEYQKIIIYTPSNDELSKSITFSVNKATVQISKQDITNKKEVEGATLTIKNSNGDIVNTWVSDNKQKSVNLAPGEYTLEETMAPEGYELSDTVIKFTINSEGKVLIDNKETENNHIIFNNTPEPEQVPTGNTITYIAGTLCLISLGISIFIIIKSKKI